MGSWIHKLTKFDEAAGTGVCASCGPVELTFRGPTMSPRCTNARKAQSVHNNRKGAHGLIPAQAVDYCQGKACAICGTTEQLFVDHDHITGQIRGVLCRKCNSAIGMLGDSIQGLYRAIAYLDRPTILTSPIKQS